MHLLWKTHLPNLPVVNEQNQVIGIVSAATVHTDMSMAEVAEKMYTEKHRSYPVVQDNKLVGIITNKAVLRAIDKYMADA